MDGRARANRLGGHALWLAPALAVLGACLYNWWIGATVRHVLPNPNMLFSDLEVQGGQYSKLFNSFDFAASVLFLSALLVAGSKGRRTEWILMLWFTVFGMTGATFHYSCAEAVEPACRSAEWRFQLPITHYFHMLSGIFEFALVIVTIWLVRRRLRDTPSMWRTVNRVQVDLLVFALPLIAATYLLDRWEAAIEPLLLVVASAQVLVSVLEPETLVDEPAGSLEQGLRRAHN